MVASLIPRNPVMKPTNDYRWLTRGGVEVEIESPMVGDYQHAENLIWKSLTKACEQQVIKDVFVVNYGDQQLAVDVLALLAACNDGHGTGRVRQLWVLVGMSLRQLI